MKVYTVEGFTLEAGVEVIGAFRARTEAENVAYDIRKSAIDSLLIDRICKYTRTTAVQNVTI